MLFVKYLPELMVKRAVYFLTAALLSSPITSAVLAQAPKQLSEAGKTRDRYPDGLLKWTPRDSSQVRYFIDRRSLEQDEGNLLDPGGPGEYAVVSPSGDKFFFVSQYGDFSCDCNVYELSVYSVSAVARALKSGEATPPPLQKIQTRHRMQAIQAPLWTDGGRSIEFKGYAKLDAEHQQVFKLDIESGDLRTLTNLSDSERLLEYKRQDSSLIYSSVESDLEKPKEYPISQLSSRRILELIYFGGRQRRLQFRTYVSYMARPVWKMASEYVPDGGPWFSPDGRYAVMIRRSSDGGAQRFSLVDLQEQREAPLLNVAVSRSGELKSEAFWSADGRQVVMSNVEVNSQSTPLASYVLADARSQVLDPQLLLPGTAVKSVGWITAGKQLIVRREQDGKPADSLAYSYRDGRWSMRKSAVSRIVSGEASKIQKYPDLKGISVVVVQDADSPPIVMAIGYGRRLELTAADPAVGNLWIAPTETFEWRDSQGVVHVAGLILPRQRPAANERIPLVIQVQVKAHRPDIFRADGSMRTAYASQSLAAEGMAVLNFESPSGDIDVQPELELPSFIDGWESAAEAVAKVHQIDLGRIGLVGFSRPGYEIRYSITHPRHLIPRAAVIDDSYTGSYFLTMLWHATGESRAANSFNSLYGGSFYESKSSWLEREVSFNVDRIQTPVLFADNGADLSNVIDTLGSFRAAGKPFDYLIMAESSHELRAPRTREASMEATVDWMKFWLQGREDAKPEKTERYARWRTQRELYEKQKHSVAQSLP